VGGYAADRWNRARFLTLLLVVMSLAFACLSIIPAILPAPLGLPAAVLVLIVWGLFGWPSRRAADAPAPQQMQDTSGRPSASPAVRHGPGRPAGIGDRDRARGPRRGSNKESSPNISPGRARSADSPARPGRRGSV